MNSTSTKFEKFMFLFINILTILRVVLIPVFFFIDGLPAFILLNFMFITDFLDGYLSRKYNVTSELGAILDLIGDKSLTIFLLVIYAFRGDLNLIISILLIAREVYSMIMRFYYLKKGTGLISASFLGKLKTTLFFLGFDMLILNIPYANVMFLVILVLSYYSLFTYILKGVKK